MRFLTNKKSHIFLLLFILAFAVWFGGSNHEVRKRIQYLTFDMFNRLHEREATDQIVIIDVDETSLKEIGQWPWPRNTLADLINKLDEYGAKSVAFDMVFAEEDRTNPEKILESLQKDSISKEVEDVFLSLPSNDDAFSKEIKKTGIVSTGFTAARPEETRRAPVQKTNPNIFSKNKDVFYENVFSPAGLATNLPMLSSAAAGNGSFMAITHVDGIMRLVPLYIGYPDFKKLPKASKLYPSLSLEAWRVSVSPKAVLSIRNRPEKSKHIMDTDYYIKLGKTEIPVNSDLKMWVHYRDIKDDEYVSASKILTQNVENDIKNKIKDKIVFVGTSAEGLRDIRATPLDVYIPGVEVHVNAVEQILQNKFLTRPNFIDGAETIVILVVGVIIILLAPFINAVWLGLFSVGTIGALFYGAFQAYVQKGVLFDPTYASGVIFLLFLFSSLLSYLRSEADKRQVKTAFGHYISPEFMEELTKSPDKLKLGGEVRDLTVMFTDIRSFTKISEKLSPEELIQLMNDFLTPMSNLVMESRGTIDKYMGDAMMAFWNAPLDDPDHARQACLTALKMNEALVPVNEAIKQRAKEGEEPLLLSAGIGINTGLCSVGNMGSKQRFAYSALGDAVNLASRLEGQTKSYSLTNLVGEDTRRLVKDLAMLEVDLIKVVGREKPVRVYTLVGDADYASSAQFKKWEEAHNDMLKAYRVLDLNTANQGCNEVLKLSSVGMAGLYEVYQDRIKAFTKNPPPNEWDGVFVAKSK